MLAINDFPTSKKYFAAVDLLSALDLYLECATGCVSKLAFNKKSIFQPFTEHMETARNLHTATKEALKAASAHLLDSDSVETFFMLAESACVKALFALELAVREVGDKDYSPYFRDRFKLALQDSHTILNAIK